MDDTPPITEQPDRKPNKVVALLLERWPEYIIEIFVIIFSISISFAVDRWKEEKEKQELEQLYLRELAHDLESDVSQLNEVIAETNQIVQRASKLIKLSRQSARGGKFKPDDILSDIRFTFKRPRFVAQDATFSNIKNAGNTQAITDFSLKNDLFDYYNHYASTVLIETAELESTNAIIGPYIIKRLPLSGSATSISQGQLNQIVQEFEFQNVMLVRQSTRSELANEYAELLSQAKRVLKTIRTQVQKPLSR